MSFRRVRAVIVKELRHIVRDVRSLIMALGLPAFLLVFFGFAISLDVDQIPTLIFDADGTAAGRDLTARIVGSRFFRVAGFVEVDFDDPAAGGCDLVGAGVGGQLVGDRSEREGAGAAASGGLDEGGVFGVVGTAFAVLLAFVIFLAFESYTNAKEEARREADAVQEHYATTSFLSPPARNELQGQLICYSRAVRFIEWPAMAELFGVDRLAERVGISVASLRRYAADQRPTPDAIAARLHLLARVVAELRGRSRSLGKAIGG